MLAAGADTIWGGPLGWAAMNMVSHSTFSITPVRGIPLGIPEGGTGTLAPLPLAKTPAPALRWPGAKFSSPTTVMGNVAPLPGATDDGTGLAATSP